MADRKTSIAAKVKNAVEAIITENGYKLWDVAYYKEGPEMILEISIDRQGGISINDCSAVTKLIEPIIDELDPIEESYCLQVASAGTVRPLNRDEHILFALDNELDVTLGLYVAVDGKKEFCGIIKQFDGSCITLLSDEKEYKFDKKQISKINADFETEIEEVDEIEEDNKEKEDEQGTL